MRYNAGISRLQKDPRYHDAKDALWSILHHRVPSDATLARVFGTDKSRFVRLLVGDFISKNPHTGKKPRTHDNAAPTEIGDKRSDLEKKESYQRSQLRLLQWQVPDLTDLTDLYGIYAPAVQKVLQLFLDSGLKRKCGISTAAHLNRVGALTGAMGIDDDTTRRYSAIGALHDCIEDLLNRVRNAKGKVYGLSGYDKFLDAHIPTELQTSVVQLTNHYDLILEHIHTDLTRNERLFTQKTVLPFLEKMMRRGLPELVSYVSRMHDVLSKVDPDRSFAESAKWVLYKELYIHDMAQTTHQMSNYRTYEIKAIDLSDNAHGRDALAMAGRIKNLIKMDMWAREGYALKSSWRPLNNHIAELEEDALVHAEHLLIRDFLEGASTLDFVSSALIKINDLSPVFYVDDTP
ncbi:MAG: hypothetical protein KF749_17725 [Bacteroidetes bacterium]|nr:hypothetical protein [Bacteroidota bacterium]MCW5896337.1 hypothetical protein [Bacteroidota bacterium]